MYKTHSTFLLAALAALLLSGCPSENTESGEKTSQTTETQTSTDTQSSPAASASANVPAQPTAPPTIGKLSRADFDRLNAEGGAALAGVTPSGKAMSEGDKALLLEIAKGGMLQLVLSQAAESSATRDDVRSLAQSETQEQRNLANKLNALATPNQIKLPQDTDAAGKDLLKQLQAKAGPAFDRAYTDQRGVKGHQQLEQLMMKVQKQAADPGLKQLASATLPAIKMHMQVSRDILAQLPAN